MTMTDRKIQARVAALQRADVPIRVSRLIGINAHDEAMLANTSEI